MSTDVTQLNEERPRRNAAALDPNSKETRDYWYATQAANHERLFPLSDNLTTLMFIVASDLSEAQRERLSSFLSLRNMTVTACTLDSVQLVFLWNGSVRRKVQWRILHSELLDTAAA